VSDVKEPTARVSALYIHPVKSLRGLRVEQAELTRQGLQNDRRWMIVDEDGTFLTQRELPELCRIALALESSHIELTSERHGSLRLPIQHESGEQELTVRVWSFQGSANRHAEGSAWLSQVLGRTCSLVYMAERHERAVNPQRALPSDRVSFADGYPILLISQGSLDDLNSRLKSPLGMTRFRPNVVIEGCEAFAEDNFQRVQIGSIGLSGVKRCERCVVTTRDELTGESGTEPLRTLATYRRSEGKVWFGMNMIHDSLGTLKVGDSVHVLPPFP